LELIKLNENVPVAELIKDHAGSREYDMWRGVEVYLHTFSTFGFKWDSAVSLHTPTALSPIAMDRKRGESIKVAKTEITLARSLSSRGSPVN
jgi:hypothetical protein